MLKNILFKSTFFNQLASLQRLPFSVTAINSLKTIERIEDKTKNEIIIQGKYIDDAAPQATNDQNMLEYKHDAQNACSFCKLEKMNIFVQHTDVLILRQFLRDDGTVLPSKVTQLCKRQMTKLHTLVKHAKEAGLLMNLQAPLMDGSKPSEDKSKRPGDLKFNRYYEDYEVMRRKYKYI